MLVNSVPKSLNFIGGHDVNANLGIRKKLYKGVIGPLGIDNRNTKGRRLLSVLSQNRLKVTNSYFKKSSFVTWRSFNASRSPHMLDVITTSYSFFQTCEGLWSHVNRNAKRPLCSETYFLKQIIQV